MHHNPSIQKVLLGHVKNHSNGERWIRIFSSGTATTFCHKAIPTVAAKEIIWIQMAPAALGSSEMVSRQGTVDSHLGNIRSESGMLILLSQDEKL
jgi:hypothetical protein